MTGHGDKESQVTACATDWWSNEAVRVNGPHGGLEDCVVHLDYSDTDEETEPGSTNVQRGRSRGKPPSKPHLRSTIALAVAR
jgi:hypothetical protein